MDPYSAEGELVNVHNAFHQGQYTKVLEFDTSSFSSENEVPAQILKLRARLALGEYSSLTSELKGDDSSPDIVAVRICAEYMQSPGEDSKAVGKAQDLAKKQGDNLGVQLLCGTVLADAGLVEEALALLAKHQGSLDAVALITQIHLQQNRLDLAQKEATGARKWAQDSLLVNIIESWVGLREGGEKYQSAYYVYEELAQAVATQSVNSLLGQAIAELHLGRIEEAEAAFNQALELDPENADVLANLVVLNTILGKDTAEAKSSLGKVKSDHVFLVDYEEKKADFERAAGKYTPKLEI